MKYRPEVDGLRAVAVIPVILFHAGFAPFAGGFVGVDVFFVISGYLITSILVADIEAGRFSLLKFYERRARRILPALFFVMACTLPLAWATMLPRQMKDFSESLIATSLFASNILFWQEAEYFGAAAEEKPLLHTWSLAVEEQFYLLFPIFLILAWKFGAGRVFWLILVLAIVSLGLSEWGARNHPSANFYLAPTRAWELFAGSLVALFLRNHSPPGSEALGLLGLAAIVVSVFLYDAETPFPGVYALLPVLGVVLILLFADGSTAAGRILSHPVAVGLGLISYSAYLWHQPFFAFARLAHPEEPGAAIMGGLALLSLGCAALSWRYIERPFRAGRHSLVQTRGPIFAASLAGIAAFALFGSAGVASRGFDFRLSETNLEILAWEEYHLTQPTDGSECFLDPNGSWEDFSPVCNGSGPLLIWGDSHAGALAYGWRELDPTLSLFSASGCAPIPGEYFPDGPDCRAFNGNMLAALASRDDLGGLEIVLHANWPRIAELGKLELLSRTLDALRELGVGQVTIVGSVPQFHPSLPQRLVKLGLQLDRTRRLSTDLEEIRRIDGFLEQLAGSHGVRFLSILESVCDDWECDGVIEDGKGGFVPVVWDYGHLTKTGALHVLRRFELAGWLERRPAAPGKAEHLAEQSDR